MKYVLNNGISEYQSATSLQHSIQSISIPKVRKVIYNNRQIDLAKRNWSRSLATKMKVLYNSLLYLTTIPPKKKEPASDTEKNKFFLCLQRKMLYNIQE